MARARRSRNRSARNCRPRARSGARLCDARAQSQRARRNRAGAEGRGYPLSRDRNRNARREAGGAGPLRTDARAHASRRPRRVAGDSARAVGGAYARRVERGFRRQDARRCGKSCRTLPSLQRVRDVLAPALAARMRGTLRDRVEGVWLALGGPACVEDATELEDAEVYLDALEELEEAGEVDFGRLAELLDELYALPDVTATADDVQIMTIHKAKGLEFDTVIVPGLDRGPGTRRAAADALARDSVAARAQHTARADQGNRRRRRARLRISEAARARSRGHRGRARALRRRHARAGSGCTCSPARGKPCRPRAACSPVRGRRRATLTTASCRRQHLPQSPASGFRRCCADLPVDWQSPVAAACCFRGAPVRMRRGKSRRSSFPGLAKPRATSAA